MAIGSPSPFVVGISDLATPGSSRSERIVAPVDWSLQMSRVRPEPPLDAELVLRAVTGGILVTGTVELTVTHACHRCLTEFDEPYSVRVTAMYMDDPDDESYELTPDTIDLEPMLRDEVLLAMPMLPRCSDDCAGVVSSPATGLNTGAAGDDEDLSGSPFAVLRDLLDPGT